MAITQARSNSTRLPGKILKLVDNKSLLEIHLERVKRSTLIDDIIVATTSSNIDDEVVDLCQRLGANVYRGSEEDVLDRFYKALQDVNCDYIVRLTSDCPLIDAGLIDEVIQFAIDNKLDYCSNVLDPSFPDGQDVEVFTKNALERAWSESTLVSEREHVTPYIWKNSTFKGKEIFRSDNFYSNVNYQNIRLTVDELLDFELIHDIITKYGIDQNWRFYADVVVNDDTINSANQKIVRNEGYEKSIDMDIKNEGTGQKLYNKAKTLIPGGTMLLSKRPEMFLPDHWPAYYEKTEGCHVWDLDGNKYLDMSIMGIGTNTLGYSNPYVDNAVMEVIKKGNMSTFNCPEEVALAERLVDMHDWSDMVRFCRTGGEANAVAIRIARAASGRDKVAICGYHGWHDWYLSTNLGGDELSGHLLPGLDTAGVPKSLEGSVLPFNYNDLEELTKIVENNPDLGVIKMEVSRNFGPKEGFLEGVRDLATKHNCVLIFDECTSGFRETFGGLHKKFGVEPDMAMFGKTLGNGYAISAIVGRKEIMEAAQKTFISSTFWTERIGPTAALAALDEMERIQSWNIITEKGAEIKKGWAQIALKYNFKMNIGGLDSLANYSLETQDWLKYKTLITQEMLKVGILASNLVYSCTSHSEEDHSRYFTELDKVFSVLQDCESGKLNINNLLDGPVSHGGFKRLN